MKFELNKTFGYYEASPKPSDEGLRQYYEETYFQNETAIYSLSYSEEELEYLKNKIIQKSFIVQQYFRGDQNKSLLELGCGEGFTLEYHSKLGWDVTGVDFSDFGLMTYHPHLKEKLIKGDVFGVIDVLIARGQQYDVVWLDNILEHVTDPIQLIQYCFALSKPGGMLVVEVPNDYSQYQLELSKRKKISRKYWEIYPDHLIYFTRQSLVNLCEAHFGNTVKVLSDFPIEWYLANEHSNYVNNKEVGKQAHSARMFIENFIQSSKGHNLQQIADFYEALAKLDQGRLLTGFFSKS